MISRYEWRWRAIHVRISFMCGIRIDQEGSHEKIVVGGALPLYRDSKGHGGIFCEGCHDGTHAIATSREPNDAIKFIEL